MRKSHILAISAMLVAMVAFASTGNAQEGVKKKSKKAKAGVGVSWDEALSNVHFPINLTKQLRIEPEFGFSMDSQKEGTETNTRSLRFGLGFFYMNRPTNKSIIYTGVRIGASNNNQEIIPDGGDSVTTSSTDIGFAGAFGGEYFLSSRISIGGEAQLWYITFGAPTVDPDPGGGGTDPTHSLITTSSQLFLRWYFL